MPSASSSSHGGGYGNSHLKPLPLADSDAPLGQMNRKMTKKTMNTVLARSFVTHGKGARSAVPKEVSLRANRSGTASVVARGASKQNLEQFRAA